MENCIFLNEKIKNNEEQSNKSFSKNQKAIDLYSQGIDESKKENFKKAIEYFEKALKIDPEFAFAWDNLGVSYRELNNYDKALESYEKSLEIDPKGITPLQNIAVVYQYKKEYQKAIETYKKLAEIDINNPEIYYGIGQIYSLYLNDYEKGLDNMCKAYNMYIKQKSPYRNDAEKVINLIYSEMKKQGKEELAEDVKKIADMANFIFIRQKGPYGNGTPVLNARHIIGNEPFAVVWGDDIWHCPGQPHIAQLVEVYERYHDPVLSLKMTDDAGTKRYGIIEGPEVQPNVYQINAITEKPGPEKAKTHIASHGGYVFTPDIFEALSETALGRDGELWLVDAIANLLKRRPIYGKIIDGDYYDTGNINWKFWYNIWFEIYRF